MKRSDFEMFFYVYVIRYRNYEITEWLDFFKAWPLLWKKVEFVKWKKIHIYV